MKLKKIILIIGVIFFVISSTVQAYALRPLSTNKSMRDHVDLFEKVFMDTPDRFLPICIIDSHDKAYSVLGVIKEELPGAKTVLINIDAHSDALPPEYSAPPEATWIARAHRDKLIADYDEYSKKEGLTEYFVTVTSRYNGLPIILSIDYDYFARRLDAPDDIFAAEDEYSCEYDGYYSAANKRTYEEGAWPKRNDIDNLVDSFFNALNNSGIRIGLVVMARSPGYAYDIEYVEKKLIAGFSKYTGNNLNIVGYDVVVEGCGNKLEYGTIRMLLKGSSISSGSIAISQIIHFQQKLDECA